MKQENIPLLSDEIRRTLNKLSDKNCRAKFKALFGGKIKYYGVPFPALKKLAQKYYNRFKKSRDVDDALLLSEQLIKTRTFEETTIGIELISKFMSRFGMNAFWKAEMLLDNINTDFNIDLLCKKVLGPILKKTLNDPKYIHHWASSTNKWRRRASAVVLFNSVSSGKDIDAAFKIMKNLCRDKSQEVVDGAAPLFKMLKKKAPKRTREFMSENEGKFSGLFIDAVEN